MNEKFFTSVKLDADLCKGSINCIKRCPTQAIRVRNGKAEITNEFCIDCAECIRICPHHAKLPSYDKLEVLKDYEYTVALPAPALYGQFNNLDDVKSKITDKTAAIIMETLQGEGGIHPATKEFIEGVAAICKEKDIVLILDEIQCGMGRSGYMFAWQEYGVQPDIMTCAKALGCGVPVGAFVLNEKAALGTLTPGDHGTTYGGNPFVCAAVSKVLDIFEKDKVVQGESL